LVGNWSKVANYVCLLDEYQLKDPEKARKAYDKIILDFPGSFFMPDARARFIMKLRGNRMGS
jgi:hypothetical protein